MLRFNFWMIILGIWLSKFLIRFLTQILSSNDLLLVQLVRCWHKIHKSTSFFYFILKEIAQNGNFKIIHDDETHETNIFVTKNVFSKSEKWELDITRRWGKNVEVLSASEVGKKLCKIAAESHVKTGQKRFLQTFGQKINDVCLLTNIF